tara:strand:+ start:16264 stop:17100 length:837 start_codon:yes stop_codon:yes gene_type:complete
MRTQLFLFAISATLLITGCKKKASIHVSGSTTVLPVVSTAAEKYKLIHPSVNIIVNAGGSGVAINQIGEGKVTIGMASRNITSDEINQYPNVQFNTISIGKDAVVPVVSSEIFEAGIASLTLNQIAQIYKGEIRNWSEVGGPDWEILCVDKEKSRGTRHVFMAAVMGDKEADAPGADLVLGSNNEEQTAIVQSNAAIGMLSNAWLSNDVVGLNIIMPDSSIVAPSLENIIAGKYPITRDLLIVVDGEPKGESKEFIDYLLSSEGQKIVEEAGYVSINQ